MVLYLIDMLRHVISCSYPVGPDKVMQLVEAFQDPSLVAVAPDVEVSAKRMIAMVICTGLRGRSSQVFHVHSSADSAHSAIMALLERMLVRGSCLYSDPASHTNLDPSVFQRQH